MAAPASPASRAAPRSPGVALAPPSDLPLIALAAAHGAVLAAWPSPVVIAVGIWWTSNTIAHNFIHRPFFRTRSANRAFAMYLTILLGIPQALWRDRHLAHHAGEAPRVRVTMDLVLQVAAVLAVWTILVARAPSFFAAAYVPGYGAGLVLCALHGFYEHRQGTTSHYGRLYNWLSFNDGYHVEHHARPGVHWSRLPQYRDTAARRSRWPAPLRWLDGCGLVALERLVLRSRMLQRLVLASHARALDALLSTIDAPIRSILIVGGGLFPRSAIVLRRLCPSAAITVVDADAGHLELARRRLGAADIAFVHAFYQPEPDGRVDLVVIPLSYVGSRDAIYAAPPARHVAVHDWIWRRRGTSRIVSPLLLKRINLLRS